MFAAEPPEPSGESPQPDKARAQPTADPMDEPPALGCVPVFTWGVSNPALFQKRALRAALLFVGCSILLPILLPSATAGPAIAVGILAYLALAVIPYGPEMVKVAAIGFVSFTGFLYILFS